MPSLDTEGMTSAAFPRGVSKLVREPLIKKITSHLPPQKKKKTEKKDGQSAFLYNDNNRFFFFIKSYSFTSVKLTALYKQLRTKTVRKQFNKAKKFNISD